MNLNTELYVKEFKSRSRHHSKLVNFILPELLECNNNNLLEFGVSNQAMSTELFLYFSNLNNNILYSVDNVDYSHKFQTPKWVFLNQRDDAYTEIENKIPKKFSLILLDTIHEANHVEKIFYYYYPKLEFGKSFFIDDISWLPYIKGSDKERFYAEINNQETFQMLLNVYYNNRNNFSIEFSFEGTGMCRITKTSNNTLNPPVRKITSKEKSFKNYLRKISKFFYKYVG